MAIKKVKFDNFEVESKEMNFTGTRQQYQIVHRLPCVIIVPELDEKLVMINEFRPAIDKYIIQFPAGKMEKGELPEYAAIRELREETGYISSDIIEIGCFYTASHFSDEQIHVFVAKNLSYVGQALTNKEMIETKIVDREQIEKYIYKWDVLDSKTVISYELWKRRSR